MRWGYGLRFGESGQMAVELAVLMPVVLVTALIAYNLARYVALCATFDQVALDAVVSQGVAPAGLQTAGAAADEVRKCIEEALDARDLCAVEVLAERVGSSTDHGLLSLHALLTRFRCVLSYRPWPSSFVVMGVPYEAPVLLHHERSLVVDRYRPGVVM